MISRKLRILVLLCILTFSFTVKAEVILEIDCNGNEISESKKVTCEGTLLYEQEGINDIEFDYQTNLDISFSSVSDFMITNRGGKVSIHTDTALYDKIMNATKIMEFTLSVNDEISDKEKLIINNIMINKTSDIKVDGYSKEFTITREIIKLDDVCTLDSITVEKEALQDFSKNKLEYRGINVTNEVIFIDAIRTSNKSSATGLGNVKVPKGETIERNIIVTAEDGTQKIYKLYITNTTPKETLEKPLDPISEEIKSNDNSLKLLELYNGKEKIEIGYDQKKEIYHIDIKDQVVNKLTIKAILNDEKATFVKDYGPRDIKIIYGYNQELIKIMSESNEERIITLNIKYEDNRNKDNTLSSLKINGEIVDLESDKLEVKLPNDTLETIIEAIPNNDKSVVKYEDVELLLGDNSVKVEVTAEDGEVKVYDVNVIREEEKILLENITVNGYELGFDKTKTNYNLKVSNDTKELSIIIEPSDVKYEILNNRDLTNGSKIIIKVVDDDSSYEYTINIQKELSVIDYICYCFFGLGVITLIASIIYYVKKKK